jgi:hypothetical protein
MDLNAWKAQLRKGAAELAALAILERKESYGLELLERIQGTGGLALSDGSIYPLLNRLQKDGKIRGRWVEDPDATHPRKVLHADRRRSGTARGDARRVGTVRGRHAPDPARGGGGS